MGNLKDYRDKELKKYIFANCISVLFLLGELNLDMSDHIVGVEGVGIKITNIVALLSVFYLYIVIFDSLLPDKIKFRLVYLWRMLPGEFIFDDIRENDGDIRFTRSKALERYSDIYSEIEKIACLKQRRKYENQEWYRIFSSVKNEGTVFSAHRDYLMLRDMYVATWLLMVMVVFLGTVEFIPLNLNALVFLFFFIIITNVSATHKGKRFVYNVIACDINRADI